VTFNDIHGGAHALLQGATVTANGGSVQVTGTEEAVLTATLSATADTSGVQFGGNNKSLATAAIIATNSVRSDATAAGSGGGVTTPGANGAASVTASNTAHLTANVTNEVKTLSQTANGLGLTLAFNSIGWQATNVLFQAIDALLGDPML